MRKFIDLLSEAAEETQTNEAERVAAFEALADAQRGDPEIAMVQAQSVMGGGVMNWAIEHIGDLTHRMSEFPDRLPYSGYEFVYPKVTKGVRLLTSGYGFDREYRENMRNNAAARNQSLDQHMARVHPALKRYADAHAKLPVYNRAQELARDAAIHLGREQFDKATACLLDLQEMLSSPEEWHRNASQYDPAYGRMAVTEAPIADLDISGDLDNEGSFRQSDLNALRNPKWAAKVRKMFEKAPFDINVYFVNFPDGKMNGRFPDNPVFDNFEFDLRKHFARTSGIIDQRTFQKFTGSTPTNWDNSINALLAENEGDGRVALTPWMVGHRLVHAIYDAAQERGGYSDMKQAEDRMMRNYTYFYRKLSDYNTEDHNEVGKKYGTTRAARLGTMTNMGEWMVDICVQWLVFGRVWFQRPLVDGEEPKVRPQIEESPLLTKARDFFHAQWNDGWGGRERAADPKEFAKWAIKTHHDKPDPTRAPYTADHYNAIDPKTGQMMATFTDRPGRMEHYRDLGYEIELMSTGADLLARDQKLYAQYVKRTEKLMAQYEQWLDMDVLTPDSVFGNATNELHRTLERYEAEFPPLIEAFFRSAIGKGVFI